MFLNRHTNIYTNYHLWIPFVFVLTLLNLSLLGQVQAEDDSVNAFTSVPLVIDALSNDQSGISVSLDAVSVVAENGSVVLNGDGMLEYLSVPFFVGEDSFSYWACDDAGNCDEGLVTIDISYSPFCTSPATQTYNEMIYTHFCDDASVLVIPSVGYELLQGQVRNYILHTNDLLHPDDVFHTSSSYAIQLNSVSNLLTNQLYYATVVTGPDSGNGVVDLNDPCSRASMSIPFIALECLEANYSILYEEGDDFYSVLLSPAGGMPLYEGSEYQISGVWTGNLAAGETIEIEMPLGDCFIFNVEDSSGEIVSTFYTCPQVNDAQGACLPIYADVSNCDSLSYNVVYHLDEVLMNDLGLDLADDFALENWSDDTFIGNYTFGDLPITFGPFDVDFGNGYTDKTKWFAIGDSCWYYYEFGSESCFPLPVPSTCLSSPGTVASDTLYVCGDETITIESDAPYIGPGDFLTYVLHSGSGDNLVNTIISNQDGEFNVDDHPNIQKNQVYYISPVIYPYDPIFQADCSESGVGTPVVFVDPPVFDVEDNFYCYWTTEDCENFVEYKEIFVTIDGGTLPYSYEGNINGSPVSGITYDGTISLGTYIGFGPDIRIHVNDAEYECSFYYESLYNFCTPFVAENTPFIGAMPNEPLVACADEAISGIASCINNVSSSLLVGYVLHSSHSGALGEVVAVSTDGTFYSSDIGEYTGPLYLSGVIINNTVDGLDILLDDSLEAGVYSVAKGTPVLFLEDNCNVIAGIDDYFDALSSTEIILDVLANDFIPDNIDATISALETNSSNGTLNIAVDGLSLIYTANDYFEGTDNLSYILCDTNDPNNCDTVEVVINVAFACPSNPGSMPSDIIPLCEGDGFAVSSMGGQLIAGDTKAYVLHTEESNFLGDVIAISTDGNFDYPAELSEGETYYVSAVTGPMDANGELDLNTSCTIVAEGTPLYLLSSLEILSTYTYNGYAVTDCGITHSYDIALFVDGGYPAYNNGYYELSGDINATTFANQVVNASAEGDNNTSVSFSILDNFGCSADFTIDLTGNPTFQYADISLNQTNININAATDFSVSTDCVLVEGYTEYQVGYALFTDSNDWQSSVIAINENGNFSAEDLGCNNAFYVIGVISNGSSLNTNDVITTSAIVPVTINGGGSSLSVSNNFECISEQNACDYITGLSLSWNIENGQAPYEVLFTFAGETTSYSLESNELNLGPYYYEYAADLNTTYSMSIVDALNNCYEVSDLPIYCEYNQNPTFLGDISNANDSYYLCPDDTPLSLSVDCIGEWMPNANEYVLAYILHTVQDNSLGDVISINTDGIFAYADGMNNIAEALFISAIYAPNDGSGNPQLNDLVAQNISFGPSITFVQNCNIVNANDDLLNVIIAEATTVDPIQNDTDELGLGLEITEVTTAPSNGTFTLENNIITYTSNDDFIGVDFLIYTVCNGEGFCDSAGIYFQITSSNVSPVATDDIVYIGYEDVMPSDTLINILANDYDPNNDLLSVNIIDENANLINNNDGTTTYILSGETTEVYTYVICDAGLPVYCDTATLSITVENLNEAPVALDDAIEIVYDNAAPVDTTFNILANDSDSNGDILSVSILEANTLGTVLNNEDGTITYIVNGETETADIFEYVICDDGSPALCDTANVSVNVSNINEAPIAVDDVLSVSYDNAPPTDLLIEASANDSDPNDTAADLVWSILTPPSTGEAINNNDGSFTYMINGAGSFSFTYTLCDDATPALCDTATVNIEILNTNESPIALDDAVSVSYDNTPPTNVLIEASANDSDPNDTAADLVWSILTPPSTGEVLNNNGSFTYFTDGAGDFSFTYTLCDDGTPALCDTATVSIEILNTNESPIALDDAVSVSYDNTPPTNVLIEAFTNDSDPNDTAADLVWSILTPPSTGEAINNNDGSFTYVTDGAGNFSFTYTLCDDGTPALCDTATVSIEILNTNESPIAVDDAVSVIYDNALPTDVLIEAFANDSDPNDTAADLVWSILTPPSTGEAINNNDGSFSYITDGAGDFSFTYTLCDDGTPALCDTATVSIEILNTNESPIAVDDIVSVSYDNAPPTDILIEASTNDSDPNDTAADLVWSILTPPSTGEAINNNDGSFSYITDGSGDFSFTYTLCDDGTPALCDTATVNIEILNTNESPIAEDDVVSISYEDAPPTTYNIIVLSNDSDPNDDIVDLTVSLLSETTQGTIVLNTDGTFTYTLNGQTEGTADVFTYILCDDATPALCDTAMVAIEVISTNESPIATDDYLTITYLDYPPVDTLINLLANDSDANNDELSVTILSQNGVGAATNNGNGTLTYTLNGLTDAPDLITYVLCDDAIPSLCDTADLYVEVISLNEAPITASDSIYLTYYTDAELPEAITIDVLANDSDPNDDVLIVGVTTQPNIGSIANNGDGTITYTAADGSDGSMIIADLSVCDDAIPAACTDSEVYIMLCPMEVPVATIIEEEIMQGSEALYNLGLADTESLYDFIINTQPEHGEISLSGDGAVYYEPYDYFYGNDSFTFTFATYENFDNCPIVDQLQYEVEVTENCETWSCVWPGDANNDGLVNNHDFLSIGVGYDYTGDTRWQASLDWEEQAIPDWDGNFEDGDNHKHADCNGDGVINHDDMLAIVSNYSFVHGKTGDEESDEPETVIYFETINETINANDTVFMRIMLGSEEYPAEDIYGISFSVNYDSTMVVENSFEVDWEGSWLTEGTTDISYFNNFIDDQQLDFAHGRTDHEEVSGIGQVGTLSFTITSVDNLIGKTEEGIASLVMDFNSILAIDHLENEIIVYGEADTTEIVGIEDFVYLDNNEKIEFYPVPSQDVLFIESTDINLKEIDDLFITNIAGQQIPVNIVTQYSHRIQLNMSAFNAGVYFLHLQTDSGILTKRILISK